jgi:hypothetical protein
MFSQPTTTGPAPAAPSAKPEEPAPAAKQTQDKAKSALDQAMAATLAAIDVPTPPSKLGMFYILLKKIVLESMILLLR